LKIKKYISVKLLIKLGLFLVLLEGAWLFDHYHQANCRVAEKSKPAESTSTPGVVTFYCTLQTSVSLKAPVQKVNLNKLCQEKLNRLILEQWNARMVFHLKEEVLKQPNSHFSLRNLVIYRYHFLHYPDEPPLIC
jgi:hypothetical protein